MTNTSLPQANVASYPEFGAVQSRYFLASFNLLFVLAAGGLMYFHAVSGPGADILIVPIQIFCLLGGVTAGAAWLYSWAQFRQLKSE